MWCLWLVQWFTVQSQYISQRNNNHIKRLSYLRLTHARQNKSYFEVSSPETLKHVKTFDTVWEIYYIIFVKIHCCKFINFTCQNNPRNRKWGGVWLFLFISHVVVCINIIISYDNMSKYMLFVKLLFQRHLFVMYEGWSKCSFSSLPCNFLAEYGSYHKLAGIHIVHSPTHGENDVLIPWPDNVTSEGKEQLVPRNCKIY